ncbi:putative intradiol ring-cleavage dioxygenase [Septoria linicola]|nr:putative intradiol ring-cleavage dioxygenase [Septoria linicola]
MAPVTSLLALGLLTVDSLAHPGHSVAEEAAERGEFFRVHKPRSIRSCANDLKRRGHLEKSLARRQEFAKHARAKRSLSNDKPLVRRDFAEYNISHASTSGVKFGDDETLLFTDNSSCILQPEVTQGPYYIDGELIRSDMSEDQEGVPLFLDIQFIDTANCEPVPAVYVDAWHCNATGVYSGVAASGNGNSDDITNLDNTFLRGLQQTDVNGVVQFESIVPGHYTGRAPHIHVLTHNVNSTNIRSNGTLLEGYGNFSTHASHVGQIFLDQDLITEVGTVEPYLSNTQDLTLNSDDSILGEEAADMDPFVQYVLIGDSIEDGILAWISLGIDTSSDQEISSAGTHYKEGGVANENGGMGGGAPGGGSGGPGGNGTAPSGAPSGAAPSGTSAPA